MRQTRQLCTQLQIEAIRSKTLIKTANKGIILKKRLNWKSTIRRLKRSQELSCPIKPSKTTKESRAQSLLSEKWTKVQTTPTLYFPRNKFRSSKSWKMKALPRHPPKFSSSSPTKTPSPKCARFKCKSRHCFSTAESAKYWQWRT